MENGLIFDIQGYSVHDGPGCRTLVFLSGCLLRCRWCCNPEGMLRHPRLLYRDQKCQLDYRCVSACPEGAIQVSAEEPHVQFNREMCESCDTLDCVEACYNEALRIAGRYYSVDDLMRILKRDQSMWGSEGGVTFTGGEPLLQKDFLRSMLQACRREYIHTAIETSAFADPAFLLEILEWTDWLLVDLKHMDPLEHKAQTGVDNNLILKNIEAVAAANWPGRLMIRLPLIPGFNDAPENLQATAGFMNQLGLKEINLLPFHRLGESKYTQLGKAYPHANQAAPAQSDMLHAKQLFESNGLHCYLGSECPF